MIKLFNGDCLEVLPTLERESIDLILIDPPYLINYNTSFRKDKNSKLSQKILNDNNPSLIKNVVPLLYNLLKENGAFYCFCSEHNLPFFMQTIHQSFNIKNLLIWVKSRNNELGDLKGAYSRDNEFIIYAVKGRHLLKSRQSNILPFKKITEKERTHSNQKPLKLIQYLIHQSSKENDIVLDCFMGSGTTGVAAKSLKRNFIGIELDKEYYKIACQRIYGIK